MTYMLIRMISLLNIVVLRGKMIKIAMKVKIICTSICTTCRVLSYYSDRQTALLDDDRPTA